MNAKNRAIAIVVGIVGVSATAMLISRGYANTSLTTQRDPNSPIVQKHDGMNHSGMTHNMDVGPADANYDLRFIDSMIPHHQGALVMAQEVLQKSKRPELIKLAKSIIADQNKEIAQMQLWRKQWYPTASATPIVWHTAMNHEMAMTAEYKQSMMMSMSLGKADAGFDRRFLDAMIPHHQGAVTMGKDLLQKSTRPQLQKLAQNIITSQQSEIDLMTQWRQKWYGNQK
jgi:uncharacterized protein (DUF305 family)